MHSLEAQVDGAAKGDQAALDFDAGPAGTYFGARVESLGNEDEADDVSGWQILEATIRLTARTCARSEL